MPGEGEAFTVARGWVADSTVAVHPRGAVATVPPRGLPPAQHLRASLQLAATGSHPLNQLPVIAEGTACALSAQLRLGAGINEVRLKRLALLKVWKRDLEVSQQSLAASVDPALRGFASKPTLLFLRLLRLIGSPAVQILENMHRGLPDTGVPATSGIFPPLPAKAPEWSVEQLLARSAGHNAELVERVRRSHPRAAEVWEQGAQAEATGSLGPAWPVEHFQDGAGGGANVVFCRKFAVCQKQWSEDESGQASCSTVIRACVDASDSPGGCCFNLTWAAAERIVCSDSEVILAQMVASQRAFGVPPVGCKDDLRKAYHQIGRRRDPVRVVQLFWHPRNKCVVGRELLSQDFGTGGAVTNANVVFRSLRDILNRWFFINADNYFDDYWSWEPPFCAASARFVTREVLKVLEYITNEAKATHGLTITLFGMVLAVAQRGPSSATALAGRGRCLWSARTLRAAARRRAQRPLA